MSHFVRQPTSDNIRNYLGAKFAFLAEADATGSYSVLEVAPRPGVEPPLHKHLHEDEAYFVLGGKWTFQCGDTVTTAEPGSFVFLPRGLEHCFTVHDDDARALIIISPGGLERHFIEHSQAPVAEGPLPAPTMPEIMQAVADVGEYGVEVLQPPRTHGALRERNCCS